MRTERVEMALRDNEMKKHHKKCLELMNIGLYELEYLMEIDEFELVRSNGVKLSSFYRHASTNRYAFVYEMHGGGSVEENQYVEQGMKYRVKWIDEISDEDFEELMKSKQKFELTTVMRYTAYVLYGLSVIVLISVGGIVSGFAGFFGAVAGLGYAFIPFTLGLIVHALSVIIIELRILNKNRSD